MKTILTTLILLTVGAVLSHADPLTITRSSYTKTNDTTQLISTTPVYLQSIAVGAISAGLSNIIVYDATTTANCSAANVVSSVTLTAVMEYGQYGRYMKGLCYSTQTNTNGVTVFYKKQ